ncbi:MAG: peptidoglycan-binding protein [Chloroflexi bacterium]|nr:peptidoglycan-binding protein [Chloroflexota bacterium]
MSRKRISTLLLVLTLVIVVAAGSWIAGSSIQSPAEAAARTAPPTPSPILIPIEARVLTSDVVTRGTARFGLPRSISIVPSALKASASIITTLPTRNTQLQEGDVLLTASGRPVFILQGEAPIYRDLMPGTAGDDVRQLEQALKRLGHDPGPIDGAYDERTSAAVIDWYTSSGWQPFEPTADQLARLHAFEQELAAAINTQLTADAAASSAPLMVSAARANADTANKAAAADVAARTAVRDQVLADPNSTTADRVSASADLEVAQTAVNAVQLEGKAAVQSAINARKAAEREAKLAADAVAQITAELDNARRKTGVQAPADEIVFVPALPVRVEQVEVAAGSAASGPVLTVTNNQLAIDSSLPLDEAQLVKPDMTVAIDEPELGLKATGVVARVANTPGTDGVDGFHIYFEILVDKADVALERFSLRLTIPVKSTGTAVMVVPISALTLAADGTSRVQVDHNGVLEFITVEPGLSADGFVEVKSINGTLSPGQLIVIGYEKK